MSIYAIGDIHGEYEKLAKLWSKISPSKSDTIVFVGDYVDRGPNPRKVITMIINWKKEGYKIITLRGNHEDMFMAWKKMIPCPAKIPADQIEDVFFYNGGWQTVKRYKDMVLPKSHIDFLRNTRVYYETDEYIFVHAGLKPGVDLQEQTYWDMLWIREEFIESDYDFGKMVIFGHTPHKEPYVDDRKICIDTGAVYVKRGYGKLTCLVLPEKKFIQVE